MNLKLKRVIIFAHDLGALTAFYRDVLGLAVLPGVEAGWVEFDTGACRLALHSGGRPTQGRPPKLAFGVDDVIAVRADLVARGAKMGNLMAAGELQLCDGTDPEGNAFQLSNRP